MENENTRRFPLRAIVILAVAVIAVLALLWAMTARANAITAEEAKSAALTDAGVAEGDVSALRCELDRDDHVPHYEVEFSVGQDEYGYDIHAQTGEVLKKHVDLQETAAPQAEPPQTPVSAPADSAAAAQPHSLTEEEALSIAYADAGLTAADVSRVWCRLDRDDGREVYEIEFRSGSTEYEYDVDALTGNILERDVALYD